MRHDYSDTVQTLTDSFSALTPELQKAAKYMLEHAEDVGLNSMRQVATAAGVMPATISRLSKALGFSTYSELREPFRQRLRRRQPDFSSRLQDVQRRGAGGSRTLFDDLRDQELDNIARTLSDEQYPILLEAVETLLASRRVYALGLRGAHAPAFIFYYAHQLFSDKCHLLDTRAGVFADQLRNISAQDSMLVVSFPPYTQLTIDAVDYAADSGVQIVAVTDSVISPAANAAKHTIITQNQSASFYHSLTGALTVCQVLITLMVARSGGDSVKIVKDAEKQLSRISAYW